MKGKIAWELYFDYLFEAILCLCHFLVAIFASVLAAGPSLRITARVISIILAPDVI